MSGFFWNIRGFNKSEKQSVMHDWLRISPSMEFGCLLETKVKVHRASEVVKKVFPTWNMVSNYEFSPLGRIWVVWSSKVKLQVLFKSDQIITCLLQLRDEEFVCSFIYASNFVEERKNLWQDIQNQHDQAAFRGYPWLLFGDYNEILDIDEHSQGTISPQITPGMFDFQNTIQYCSLVDLRYHGPQFTWCNKREDGLICKKLDRALHNPEWRQCFPQSYCVMESGGCSDHLRGLVFLTSDITRKRGPFKFTNTIASQPDFQQQLRLYWGNTVPLHLSTSTLFRFSKKLKGLKPILRNISRNTLSDISRRAAEAYRDLCVSQQNTISDPLPQSVRAEAEAYERWEKFADLEERFLKQRSKLHWLQVGDKNNKAFYNAVVERRAVNAIHEVQTPTGTRITNSDGIKAEATRFFEKLLSCEPPDFSGIQVEDLRDLISYHCSEQTQAQLVTEVTTEEIKKVLFSMPTNKSPGPDGYTVEFFKEAWDVVGEELTLAVKSFFIYGFLPKGMNTTILALIPKKVDACEMKDYRPISCCNVLYKIISKIIANRLKKLLPEFISPNQSAFLKDRLLMENLLLATELVKDYHKDNISSRCAMKLDISKAFDSVQWPFLLNLFSALNFPPQFIHWINLCISTASFSVQVNGELSGFFRSKRGLRQGCSLSPYLFVMCMEILSKLLDKAANERIFGYHPKCKNQKLTHLCFADDIMVFSDGTARSMERILEVLNNFAAISGLRISLEKSTLFLAGVSALTRAEILRLFPFESGALPVRYLGLPLLTKRMTLSDCLPLLEKIRSRISSWKNRFLSFAGRLQLLSSVIFSLTNFWISAFRLPSTCITEIEKICSAFLWSGPDLNPKKSKVAWSDVCKPKMEGGLGLRSLADANKVSCLKLIWRITSAKSLWVDWIKRELLRNESFWSVKDSPHMGSWMWRKLLKYRQQAKGFSGKDIRSGAQTSFWYDTWCSLGSIHVIVGDRGFIDLGIPSSASVADALRDHRRRHHRRPILNRIESELDRYGNREVENAPDVALWRHRGDKFRPSFSTKDTWWQLRRVEQPQPGYKGVWFSASTPKFSFFTWLAALNRLSTGDRMYSWNSGVSTTCVLCNDPWETRDHLFFSCPFSTRIWENLSRGLLQSRYTSAFGDILTLLSSAVITSSSRFIIRYVFQATAHTIWGERNGRRHGETPNTSEQLIKLIDRLVRNRLLSLQCPGSSKFEDGLRTWLATRS